MKSTIKYLYIAFIAASLAVAACNSGSESKSDAKEVVNPDSTNRPLAAGEKAIYQCPMDADQKSDKPGKCPKCGMQMERVIVKDTVK